VPDISRLRGGFIFRGRKFSEGFSIEQNEKFFFLKEAYKLRFELYVKQAHG
jgi:hypothetical protein